MGTGTSLAAFWIPSRGVGHCLEPGDSVEHGFHVAGFRGRQRNMVHWAMPFGTPALTISGARPGWLRRRRVMAGFDVYSQRG